jgi:hypothetical protein
MAIEKDPWDPEPQTRNAAGEYEAERRAAIAVETSAMRDAFAALQPLDNPARKRTLRWLADALENIEVPF